MSNFISSKTNGWQFTKRPPKRQRRFILIRAWRISMRLQRAVALLKQNAGTVAEIAYMVGFNTPNYFAKCFRKQFGCSPSEYKMKISQEIS